MRKRWCVLSVALMLVLGVSTSWGITTTESERPKIQSDEMTLDGDLALYQGIVKQVRFTYRETSITADRIIWDSKQRLTEAEGNVVLQVGTELSITCTRLRYDLATGHGAAAFTMSASDPWYAWGEKIYRISADEYRVHNGYVTTDDYLVPNWRIRAKTIVIEPGVKVVAYNAVVYAGRVPILYWPKYVQRLDDKRSPFTIKVGRTSEWGAFILTAYNFMIKKATASIHLDYREKQQWATGFDVTIPMPNEGEGDLTTYYADDQSGQRDEDQRWRISYTQRQPLSERWDAWLELHKLSDENILEDFFRKEFQNEVQPRDFLHLQRYDARFMLNVDLVGRLNEFYDVVERLPEVSIEFPQQRLGLSPFYYQGTSSISWLERRYPEGAVDENEALLEDYDSTRVDSWHLFSYPKKYFGWLTVVPRLGLRGTYYTEGVTEDDLFRGIVLTEIEFFTKIFRVWETEQPERNIHGLRHVIEPRLIYTYTPEVSKRPTELLQFDAIDELDEENRFRLGARNKLQTKRDGGVWDLIDFDTYIDYYPEDNAEGESWGDMHHDLEIRPSRSFWIDVDLAWDVEDTDLSEFNTQMTVFNEDIWLQSLEYRYRKADDAHLIAYQTYEKLTELWWLETYLRYNIETSETEEGELALTRDLRTWTMTFAYRYLDDDNQFWVLFALKAYPESGIRASQ